MRHSFGIGPRTNAEREDRTQPPDAVDRRAKPPGSSISRSSFCHAPQGETEVNLALMRLIDRQLPETPFHGVQQMTWHLCTKATP